jgi:kinesin family protein 15
MVLVELFLFSKVIIRLRPLSGSEISVQGHSKCVRQESCQTITWTGHPESRFTFDLVADETVTQVYTSFYCLFFG